MADPAIDSPVGHFADNLMVRSKMKNDTNEREQKINTSAEIINKKLTVQWINEASCFLSTSLDSLRFRIRNL